VESGAMKTINQRRMDKRKRLFKLFIYLMERPGEHRITTLTKTFGVSHDTILRDLKEIADEVNQEREYIQLGHGKVVSRIQQITAPLTAEMRVYLLIALKQMEKHFDDSEGERSYRKLWNFIQKSLSQEEFKDLLTISDFIFISNYARSLKRESFYQAVHIILRAIQRNSFVIAEKGGRKRYLDPYGIFLAKGTFYFLAKEYSVTDREMSSLKHYRFDRLSKWAIEKNIITEKVDTSEKVKQAKTYISKMWEAEGRTNGSFYMIEVAVYDKKVFSRIKERQWAEKQKFIETGNGEEVGRVYFYNVSAKQEVIKWVLGWGANVELITPEEWRNEICEHLFTSMSRYAFKK
jgi:predicted DNA-binding transcriptional regulator YafY